MLVAIALSALIIQALHMFKKDGDNSPAAWELDVDNFVVPVELYPINTYLSEEDDMPWADDIDVVEIVELPDFVSELDHEILMSQLDEMIIGCDTIMGQLAANDVVCQMLAA